MKRLSAKTKGPTLAQKVVDHKTIILIVFALLTILSVMLSGLVTVNYDLLDYLPEDTPSTVSLEVMSDSFDTKPPNVRAMVSVEGIPEALSIKEQISEVTGVSAIYWLDDAVNVYQPLEAIPESTLESWYQDGNALFSILIDDSDGQQMDEAISQIREIIGEDGAMSGDAVNTSVARQSNSEEIKNMFVILLPILILILVLSTSSWFEPVLFLVTIGVSVLINNGTNALLGEVSFLTQTTASVLQLAVSMDYSIFLLHRFAEHRKKGLDVKTAMVEAMKGSFSSILGSGLTTVIGFAALTVMQFKIGQDLGVVLAKGIILSLITVLLLLPVLTVLTYKLIDKTRHRSFLPSFKKFGRFAVKFGLPVLVLVGLFIVPSYLAQQSNSFIYGASAMSSSEDTQTGQEEALIDEMFGKSNQMVLMVPEGDLVMEEQLADALYDLPHVTSVASYVTSVGAEIPQEIVPEETLSQFVSGGYSRMVINVSASQESEAAFDTVEAVRNTANAYYGGDYYLTGGSTNVYDMKSTVIADNKIVSLVTVIAIGIVILLMFRSLSVPLVLLVTIESAIWINLSFTYFGGESLSYLGYMIISAVQLGATVDYAILFATRYRENRRLLPKKEAAVQTVAQTTGSILTSASILAAAGFIMGMISTNGVIGQLGILIGRGALLSAFMVLFLLPALLTLCDRVIQKTTLHANFLKGDQKR